MTDADRHREEMKALQSVQREKLSGMAEAGQGLMVVYTGRGKGKSSSAFGLIVRRLGWGGRVGVVQFIKGKWVTGERQFFAKLPAEQVVWKVMGEGFTWDVQDLERGRIAAGAALEAAGEMLRSGDFDLVVLDEVHIAIRSGYLPAHDVLAVAQSRALHTDVVLTGRDAPLSIVEAADLVTEMTEVKHPFQKGVKAKRGLDF